MELRVLKYFLTVARKGNISKAAEALHLSQPTLSRQLKDLEDELDRTLMIRGARRITLTEEGRMLQKRAAEILDLTEKALLDVRLVQEQISGDIRIGAGESELFRYIAGMAAKIHTHFPDIHFHIVSGDGIDILEQLEKGLLDFGLLFQDFDPSIYDSILLPEYQRWGVLMRSDSPLASQESVITRDLWDKPLILSRAVIGSKAGEQWFGIPNERTNIVATYSLIFNASILVEEGLGYAICFDQIINTEGNDRLCFKPFKDTGITPAYIVWKKHQTFNKAGNVFLQELKNTADSFLS